MSSTTPINENLFDFLIIGTGYTQSLLSSALASSGYKCLHVDKNDYYGGSWATLPLSSFTAPSQINKVDNPHKFLISLHPSVLLTQRNAPTQLQNILKSSIFNYLEFKLVDGLVYNASGQFTQIPKSKQEVFRSDINVREKRMLMKFLQSVSNGDYKSGANVKLSEFDAGIPTKLFHSLVFSFGMAISLFEPSHQVLDRIASYLHAHGAYGPSSFLYAQYGGVGDIIQGYCRSSAVRGTTFILNHDIEDVVECDGRYNIRMSGIDGVFNAGCVIGHTPTLTPFGISTNEKRRNELGRVVMVLSNPPTLKPLPESPIIVYEPGIAFANAVQAHYEGASAGVCPVGYYMVYLVVNLVGNERARLEDLFRPYITSLIETEDDIAFMSIYTEEEVEYEDVDADKDNIHTFSTPITVTAPFIQPSECAVEEAMRIYQAATGKAEMFAEED
ncbi:hypothetical protein E3P77_03579 [Wallemia ichthyophaga]|nr:hypothetical protein E3P77_03579 [Wallemia ichthyophaga]